MVDGSPEPIESRFKLGYGSVGARCIGTGAAAGRASAGASSRRSASTRTSSASARWRPRCTALEPALPRRAQYAAPCGDFAAHRPLSARAPGGRRAAAGDRAAAAGAASARRSRPSPAVSRWSAARAPRAWPLILRRARDPRSPRAVRRAAAARRGGAAQERRDQARSSGPRRRCTCPRDLQRGGRPDGRALTRAGRPARAACRCPS